jgi:signal transduction histidine kinase
MVEKLTSRFKHLSAAVADGALAVALTVFGWLSLAARPFEQRGPGLPQMPDGTGPGSTTNPFGRFDHPTPVVYVLTAVSFLPLAFRRRFPMAVLAITSLGASAYELGHYPPNFVFLAPLVALYTVASMRDRRTAIVAGTLAAIVQLGAAWMGVGAGNLWTEAVRIVALLGAAGALGDASRSRRAYIAEVEQRALEAERTREEEASRRVDEERLRIARELHDVTAHSLSIIAVQSGAASHVIDSDPAEARRSLEAIRRTSKDALDELRAMLGVLRAAGDGEVPLAPMPSLSRIDELVTTLRDAGHEVTADVDDDLGEIPAVVEGSAFRIVQEAFTNVVRHAGQCHVVLVVRREDDALAISVDDDGRTPPTPLPLGGHGLAGMRERVTALGGQFEAGPRDAGGFRVAVHLPIARSS